MHVYESHGEPKINHELMSHLHVLAFFDFNKCFLAIYPRDYSRSDMLLVHSYTPPLLDCHMSINFDLGSSVLKPHFTKRGTTLIPMCNASMSRIRNQKEECYDQ